MGITSAVISYLIGSISFPGLYAKLKGIDLKGKGEGHAGATSILTATGNITLFLFLGILDGLKGFIAMKLFGTVGLTFALLGHFFPIFTGFFGGNGVSVYYGGVFSVAPGLAIVLLLLEGLTSRILKKHTIRHLIYLILRALPAVLIPPLRLPYLLLLLRHLAFYYRRFFLQTHRS